VPSAWDDFSSLRFHGQPLRLSLGLSSSGFIKDVACQMFHA
jgi:hypothetical protein